MDHQVDSFNFVVRAVRWFSNAKGGNTMKPTCQLKRVKMCYVEIIKSNKLMAFSFLIKEKLDSFDLCKGNNILKLNKENLERV